MVRDAEPRGGGPLRRGNPMPPEAPETVAPVPPIPDTSVLPAARDQAPDTRDPAPSSRQAPAMPPAPTTRAAASAARTIPPVPPRPDTPRAPTGVAPAEAASLLPPLPQTLPTLVAQPTTGAAPHRSTPPPSSSSAADPTSLAPAASPHSSASPPSISFPPSASSPSSRRLQREQGVERPSFLQQERREEPARRGGRGFLNRVGFSLGPNARERAIRDDEHAVSMHWPGPRTVAVVNGKGGAGKTPATVLLSAVFAQYGGAGVLAWDNNQTRGTLGWRTETGAHDRTLLELLPQTQHLLGAQGQSADLAHYVHHQPQEKYDVLRSKPIRLAHENRLSPADVDSIHAVAAKFYRLIIIDSGNDESDPMWLRMIDLADQLVVATTTRDDHAEAGALLLEALEDRDERSARLAQESVVIVSQADPKATPGDVADVVGGYSSLAREVVPIPFDREMVDGHLRLRALAEPAQQAWLSAAAAVARGF